jgi:hypothetical protein
LAKQQQKRGKPLSSYSEKESPTIHPNFKFRAEEIVDSVREPMLVLDKDLRVWRANSPEPETS